MWWKTAGMVERNSFIMQCIFACYIYRLKFTHFYTWNPIKSSSKL